MLLRSLTLMCILLSTAASSNAQVKINSVPFYNNVGYCSNGCQLVQWRAGPNDALGQKSVNTYVTGHATEAQAVAAARAAAQPFVAQVDDLVRNQVGYVNNLVNTATQQIISYNTGNNLARSSVVDGSIKAVYDEVNRSRTLARTLTSLEETAYTQAKCIGNAYRADGNCSIGATYDAWMVLTPKASPLDSVNSILPD